MLKVKTPLFPAAKALKHNKRQEKTEGIEAPRENPQTNKTAQEDGMPRSVSACAGLPPAPPQARGADGRPGALQRAPLPPVWRLLTLSYFFH